MGRDSGMEDGVFGHRLKYRDPEYWKKLYYDICDVNDAKEAKLVETFDRIASLCDRLENECLVDTKKEQGRGTVGLAALGSPTGKPWLPRSTSR